ncbi:MAG: hypothetical protein EPN47_09050 [Acidobacteria bacterium]|nr:MAG: hypothetical protein EPN47_09050 [Acidobacteriota bacterium]
MQLGDRHVLTIEDLPLILKALNTLSTAVESEGDQDLRTLKRLEEFAKEGCGRLILNLDAIEEHLTGTPQDARNVGASLVGGVLVVTCQVTSRELLQIKVLTRRHSFPKQLISSFDALFSSAAARLRTAVSRMGGPKAN